MFNNKINTKHIFSWLLTLLFTLFSLPSITFATTTGSIYIENVEYTSSTLSKGDTFSLKFDFFTTENTNFKSVSVSGEAIDSSKTTPSVTSGNRYFEGETAISAGEIVSVEYLTLTYTGVGTAVKISVATTTCGTKEYSFDLHTMTVENSKGALVVDSSSNSNLSFKMSSGQSKQFNVPIKNAASSAIKNGVAKVYFSDTTVGLSVTSGQYTEITSLNSGSTRNLSFTVNADSSVKAGTYKLIVELNDMKQEISISVDSDINPPSLELSIDENATFSLGEISPLTINIVNVGGKIAKNIKVTIQNDSDLAVVGNSNVKTISELKSGSSTSYSSKIQLTSSPSSNLVLLKLGLSYLDESGESYSDTQSIYLNTDSAKNTNDLSITNISSSLGTYSPDQDFAVSFNISSKYGAENVKVTVKPDENIIAKSQSVFVLSKLAAGKSQKYTVTLAATDKATTGNHPIEILLEYQYQNKDFSMSQYSSVNVTNEEDDDDLTSPKVILSECIANPQIVQAGQDVTINFTFLNTHASKTIYNLTATLDFNTNKNDDSEKTSSATNLFSPVSSSNTLFTSFLAPGQSNSQSIIIGTSISATAASYDVYVDLSYQDEEGKEITSRETIPITISQDINIDIAQIDLSKLSVGRSSALTATIYNTSKADISNVMMYIESDAMDTGFSVTDNKSYLSSFSMGATEYYAPTLIGLAGGIYEANLVIEYEDCLGEAQVLHYPFQIEVVDNNLNRGNMQTDPKNGNMPDMKNFQKNSQRIPNRAQNSSINPFVIGGIIVGIAALLLVILKKMKKRKSSKDFNINE